MPTRSLLVLLTLLAFVAWPSSAGAGTYAFVVWNPTMHSSLHYFSAFDQWPSGPDNDPATESCVALQTQEQCKLGRYDSWGGTPADSYERAGLRRRVP